MMWFTDIRIEELPELPWLVSGSFIVPWWQEHYQTVRIQCRGLLYLPLFNYDHWHYDFDSAPLTKRYWHCFPSTFRWLYWFGRGICVIADRILFWAPHHLYDAWRILIIVKQIWVATYTRFSNTKSLRSVPKAKWGCELIVRWTSRSEVIRGL